MGTVIRELFPGEILYRQGDPSDCAWLVEHAVVDRATALFGREFDRAALDEPRAVGRIALAIEDLAREQFTDDGAHRSSP